MNFGSDMKRSSYFIGKACFSRRIFFLFTILYIIFAGVNCEYEDLTENEADPAYPNALKTHIIPIDTSMGGSGRGGMVVFDIDNISQKGFIVTKSGYITVFSGSGKRLWRKSVNIQLTSKSEYEGLPGLHSAGIQSINEIESSQKRILFLTIDNFLFIAEGNTGKSLKRVKLKPPKNADRWEHIVVANFRGEGDKDLLLQATNAEGYRMGRFLAAYAIEDLMEDSDPQPIWSRDDFIACAHNGARVADLDGDGKDEVLGGTVIGPDGDMLFKIPIEGHVDSIFVADIRPDIPGLEVVALEEGGDNYPLSDDNRLFWFFNRVFNKIFPDGDYVYLYNHKGLIWKSHYKHWEPQNAAVGDFDPDREGLEIWCRSRFNVDQKPFVFDAKGELIANYELNDTAPDDWTREGIEVIFPIHWTGQKKQLIAAKERHTSGDVAIVDPLTGKFLFRFEEEADRLYVVDVMGDWREEIVVLNKNEIRIYQNEKPNPRPDHPRLWTKQSYRRNKMTWNYYSP